MLKHLKRVFIQFHPSDAKATAARELLALVGNDKARKSNSDCVVDYKVVETVQVPRSFVELQFADNEQHKLFTADLKVGACCLACYCLRLCWCCVSPRLGGRISKSPVLFLHIDHPTLLVYCR
eukprot:GHRQ01013300.1.p2 GENE.GHRQ01013300.1~~GHRQ01013300.1.p2  ORF type:complete len:123 (+),score=19.09 GHRQ01013300.1:395-763(+)